MKKLLIVNCLLLCISAFGQTGNSIDGMVADEHGVALPYVSIGIVGTTVGTVSGPDGSFVLFLSENVSASDSVRFSMIGHAGRSFSISELLEQTPNKIELPSATVGLPEVVVCPRGTKTKQIGMERPGTSMSTNFAISKKPNQNLGAEIGRKFNLPKGEVQLDTFQFYVSHNNFDTVRFRVNVYELKKGKPGHNIAPSNIVVEMVGGQSGWVKVDLTPYHIIVSENVAVSVEWVYHSAKGKALALPIAMPSLGIHFYKYGSQGKWKVFPGMSAAMSLDVSVF